MFDALSAGDVTRRVWPSAPDNVLNLYLGSGRAGACFDAFGLMGSGRDGAPRTGGTPTVLSHADHWHRGAQGLDSWLPLARLDWAKDAPPAPDVYAQDLTLINGRLETRLQWPGLKLRLRAAFDPQWRDVLAVEVEFEGQMPALVLSPEGRVERDGNDLLTTVDTRAFDAAGSWLAQLQAGTANSALLLQVRSEEGAVRLGSSSEGASIEFAGKRGRHLLLIATGAWERRGELEATLAQIGRIDEFWRASEAHWRARWGDSFVHLPQPEHQALWARAAFRVLASYAPDVRSPAAPMGWAGHAWGRHFPQDLSYVHPAILRLGHLDIARACVEFYAGEVETMREATARLYRVASDGEAARGAMWAWEFPIGPNSRILPNGSSNPFQWEIHNAAYPARMAFETAKQNRNPDWTRAFAWPVIRESARFYAGALRREPSGTWSLHILPSMGQDEHGGQNRKNYLDALLSARYCLQSALEVALQLEPDLPDLGQWRAILDDGFSFEHLRHAPSGLLASCEPASEWRLGRQKHPVQFGPLVFLPQGNAPQAQLLKDAARRAFEVRDELCVDAHRGYYHGWTLATHWLAASRLGDADALESELRKAIPSRYVDADWLQIFESSGSGPGYVTSDGLYLQAVHDAFVCDFWGETRLNGAVPEAWRGASFHDLHTLDGQSHSSE